MPSRLQGVLTTVLGLGLRVYLGLGIRVKVCVCVSIYIYVCVCVLHKVLYSVLCSDKNFGAVVLFRLGDYFAAGFGRRVCSPGCCFSSLYCGSALVPGVFTTLGCTVLTYPRA